MVRNRKLSLIMARLHILRKEIHKLTKEDSNNIKFSPATVGAAAPAI